MKIILKAYDTLIRAENNGSHDAYEALHDYTNNYVKKVCFTLFSLTMVIGILAMAILLFYFIFKSNCLRIIYVFIWNISLPLMFLSLLLSVIFGIFSYVLHDGIRIINIFYQKKI